MNLDETVVSRARTGDANAFRDLVEPYRRELRAHCYRMAGSLHDADDLLQDSLLKAWRGIGGFEGRSSIRTWLYRVATSACLDALEHRSSRVLPQQLAPAADPLASMVMGSEPTWLEPCPDDFIDATHTTPESRHGARESVGLAFLVALQVLPPRQRAVLLLRDVLGWDASECAELLATSVAAANSALQRARETLAERAGAFREDPQLPDDAATTLLLGRYVNAWEQADVGLLVSLLREDATLSMPPFASWFRGAEAIGRVIAALVLKPEARGDFTCVRTAANGLPAFAVYQLDPTSGERRAAALHLLRVVDGRLAAIDAFLDPSLFARFGLPVRI